MMYILIADLHKYAAAVRQQFPGQQQTVPEIGEIGVDAQLPGVPEGLNHLRLLGEVLVLPVLHIPLVHKGLEIGAVLDAVGRVDVHHLHLTFTTGIEGAEVLNLVIAPNPTRTGITAYAEGPWTEADVEEGLTLEILDAAGRRIRTEEVKRVPIAIDGLNVSGMYIVRITSKDGTAYTGRLIVK